MPNDTALMRVLVTGSTHWDGGDALRSALSRFPAGTTVVTGDTGGIDDSAANIGVELGFRVQRMQKTRGDDDRFPGEAWKGLNERMVASGVSLVLAFHPDLGKPGCARGSQHVIDLATAAGIAVEIFRR